MAHSGGYSRTFPVRNAVKSIRYAWSSQVTLQNRTHQTQEEEGAEHQWWMTVNTKPGAGTPKDWEKMGGGGADQPRCSTKTLGRSGANSASRKRSWGFSDAVFGISSSTWR